MEAALRAPMRADSPRVGDAARDKLPTALSIAHRVIAVFILSIACRVVGAGLILAGGILSFMRGGSINGLALAVGGFLMIGAARFLLRGGLWRWTFRPLLVGREALE